MKNIQIFDDAADTGLTLDELGFNGTLYWAYMRSKDAENEYIDFNEVIWDKDIEPIIDFCKTMGVDHITISSTFSSLTTTVWQMTELGCTIEGMTQVNATHTDWQTGKRARVPAFLIRMPQA
jgi:hypothetical protein